ncbi:MAG: hypothetical protein M3Q58_16115 [Bacteroidota bacterium]|nr:hypothetical protein [Bacteroidota bacterium]
MADRNKKYEKTGKKNQEDEKPLIDEDLKETGKGITSSKGSFKTANDLKGKSEKKK